MARPYRLQGEDCLYHITSRGDDRKRIFLSRQDYLKFMEYILLGKEKFKFYLYAYCLMGNHYHLLLETTKPNISALMQYINTAYTAYYNTKRNRCGHLFQGRYKSILVDADFYFLELTRYIHLNPVKAKIVADPKLYQWSSYKGYVSRKGDGFIDKERVNRYLGMNSSQYRLFVQEGLSNEFDPFKNLYAGFILGKPEFIKDKLKDLRKQTEEDKELSYKKELYSQHSKQDILEAVAKYYKKSTEYLCQTKNRPAREKKIAVYLMKRLTALTNNQIGAIFGISFSAASKAAKDIKLLIERDKKIRGEVEKLISSFKV